MNPDNPTTPDKFQQAWQAVSSQTRVTVDADSLANEVQRSQRLFQKMIFWRDCREIGVALLLIPVWIVMGITLSLPWTWYLGIPASLWIAGFMLVDRKRHPQKLSEPGEPLLESAKNSLAQVEHQIWLLRNILWWYVLPAAIATAAFFGQVTWESLVDAGRLVAGAFGGFLFAFLFGVYYLVYYVNQLAVRKQLEPQRQELRALLASLGDDSTGDPTGEVAGDYPILMSGELPKCSTQSLRRRLTISGIVFLVLLSIGIGGIFLASWLEDNLEREYPKRSPFSAVRWQESQPEVKISESLWSKLYSIDGVPTEEIVAFSRETYGSLWQKRFEEDLVELLTRMGNPPQEVVTLVVQPLGDPQPRTLEQIPMTRANREAIRDAAEARESGKPTESAAQPEGKGAAVPLDNPELFRQRVDELLTFAHTEEGFSGAVLVAKAGKPIYEGALGFSHLESRAPNTLDTPFRIASLSKQFTAAAIFRLATQGKLYIDDPVHKYLSEFAEPPYRDITIHQLLTHTSGLPRIPEGFWGFIRWSRMSEAATPVDDYVALAVDSPLKFQPGDDYEYSNIGYRVLSALIARVTGREYADYMEEEIFRPLGMNDSGVARVDRPPSEDRVAEGLKLRNLAFASEPSFTNGEEDRNFGTGYGSGGIYTSARDLVRWDRALAGNEFLSESDKQQLFKPVIDYYACGWIVKKSGLDGRVYQMHNGANDGFFCQMMRVPADDLVIIALANVDSTPALDELVEELFRLCRSLPYRAP